jgi:hypothetical protein
MFLIDNLLMAPGKAVMFLLEEVAKKAQEEFLDDDSVKQELQEIYAMLEAGKISEKDFEAREYRLVERLQQIAMTKLQEHAAGLQLPAIDVAASMPALDVIPALDVTPDPPAAFGTPPHVDVPLPVLELPAPQIVAPPAPVVHAAPPTPATGTLTMGQVVECATRGLAMLKLKVSAITSVARDESGWKVTAELVERRGVPDTSDLLGVYELRLDDAGNVLRYERTRMRRRCDLNR